MSQSPTEDDPTEDDPVWVAKAAAYHAGWAAVSRLVRRGLSWSGHERDCAFLNLGGARFADVSAASGLDLPQDGRAALPVDWDLDGDQDLVITARTGPRVRVLRNDQDSGHGFQAVRLVGTRSNTDGIGARVEVTLADGRRLVSTRRAGEGFLAQSSAWLHFGLGASRATELRVRWPAGAWESFGAPRPNRFLILVEGAGTAREWPAPSVPTLAAAPTAADPPGPSEPARDLIPRAPVPMPQVTGETLEGSEVRFLGVVPGGARGTGRPLLLTLASHTCAPCARELAELESRSADFAAAGVDVLVLAVDPPEEREALADFVATTGFTGTVGLASPETLAMLDALVATLRDHDRRLGVPTSFLVDGEGLLQAVYFGALDPQRVLADLVLGELPEEPRRFAALPFMGRFTAPAAGADLAWLEAAMNRHGLPRVAAQFALGRVQARKVGEAELALGVGRARLQQGNLPAALQAFEQATALDPYRADGWKGLGYCRHRQRELSGARDAYREAARLDPEDHRNRVNLGLVLIELGDLEGAAREAEWLRSRSSEVLPALEAVLEAALERSGDG